MNTFLDITAKHTIEKASLLTEGRLNDFTIIFPNKRASLFFNKGLSKYLPTPFWAPHYTTISEIYQNLSNDVVADPILLVFYLHRAYCEVTGSHETFDQFYSWGEILLNDFEDIDNNMVNAEKLFINITDIEQLTDFQFIDEDQEASIRKLFNNFSTSTLTELHQRYLQMWEAMPNIYHLFKKMLRENGLAYEGMMKRNIAEQLSNPNESENINNKLSTIGSYIEVVGFNVLNATDKALFLYLRNHFNTSFYWDYDETYIKNSSFEAGQFISDNIKLFGNALSDSQQLYKGLHQPKDIHFVSSVTDNAQSRYVGDWLQSTLAADSEQTHTAIVLCDENLLLPVLHSIPSTFGNESHPTLLNITMGYPMQNTPAVGFVLSLLELYFRGWVTPTKKSNEGKWRYIYVEKVLQHPYTMLMNKKGALTLIESFKRDNNTYPSAIEFHDEFIADIFRPSFLIQNQNPSVSEILHHTSRLLQEVSKKLASLDLETTAVNAQLYSEANFTVWTLLNHFFDLIDQHHLTFETPETLIRLIRQAISRRNIAFHGEPAVGVQLMGILETRNLDFEHVIMLSVNEGVLPKSSSGTSFILNFLREANGMTTNRRQVSLYAYYFYRIISRAKHITLVYNNATEGLHRGEMSRFMMQLYYEREIIFSPQTAIHVHHLQPSSFSDSHHLQMKNHQTPDNSPLIGGNHGVNKLEKLSPTALNTYINCPFHFYLQYVCNYRQEDEINEDVADNIFGSIFHNALEWFYADKIGIPLTNESFKDLIKETDGKITLTPHGKYVVRRCVDRGFAKEMFHIDKEKVANDEFTLELNGTQLLNHEVISRYVEKQLRNDYMLCPLTIINTEKTHEHLFQFPVDGMVRSVKIGGIIDREDIVTINGQQIHRIVDYKTSNRAYTAKSVEELFIPSAKRSSYIFQAFYYSEVLVDNAAQQSIPLQPIAPTLLYIKQQQSPTEAFIKLGSTPVTDYGQQCHESFNHQLKLLLADIFRSNATFPQTSDDSHCKYCPFNILCQRSS